MLELDEPSTSSIPPNGGGDPQFVNGVSGFDPSFYLRRYLDVPRSHEQARRHYIQFGHAEGRYRNADDLDADRTIIIEAGLFDEAFYLSTAPASEIEPAVHYLLHGWRGGIQPSAAFEGEFLRPYLESAGYRQAPAVAYAQFKAAGWSIHPSAAPIREVAEVVARSDFFDAASYAVRAGIAGTHLDPAIHYVLVGERMGFAPSERFDPCFYAERCPDVVEAGFCLLWHFAFSGAVEGRRPVSVASRLSFDTSRIDPSRETVLLVTHQASRTGAPILGLEIAARLRRERGVNVVSLLLVGGGIADDFAAVSDAVIGPLTYDDWHPVEAQFLVARLRKSYAISYAIVNSIDSRLMLEPLSLAHIPTVALVHEFPSYVPPRATIGKALEWATRIVFPARIVADAIADEYPNLDNWPYALLPQGPSVPPRGPDAADPIADAPEAWEAAFGGSGTDKPFVVLGAGTVFIRKGVDVFISVAAAVKALAPKRPVRFVWVGQGYAPESDLAYSSYLAEQISRCGLEDDVVILDEVEDLEPVYAASDLFLLSSRLDPLPNVSIDAALRGLPVVCFDKATGMAEILGRRPATRDCVVPYLDVAAAARAVADLADDDAKRDEVAGAIKDLARETFDMSVYVAKIDDLGRAAREVMEQREADVATIVSDLAFDALAFGGREEGDSTREDAVRRYVARSAALGSNKNPTANFYFRRPVAGFHPQIYGHHHRSELQDGTINALADWIRRGRPAGPWAHEVLEPAMADAPCPAAFRVAVQGHFYYPELIEDLLRKLAANATPCDLLLSTGSETNAEVLRRAARGYHRGKVVIRVVPNRGRDIGPFLTAFAPEITGGGYDVVAHVHGKRSLFTDEAALGESWREFLWQNLVGELHPMMDLILSRFAKDDRLGLVFPEDPHLPDWDSNREIAEGLAERMGLTDPLPPYFDFPVGTMFWARPKALKPLFDLDLTWDDYPPEPIGIDGTILHALERMTPFAVGKAGFRWMTTHVPGVTW